MGKIEKDDLLRLNVLIDTFNYDEAIELAVRMGLEHTAEALRDEREQFRLAGAQGVLFRADFQ